MTSRVLIFILTFTWAQLFAQQEASVWYFGQNAGLKFEQDGNVTTLSDGLLSTHEGCSSIADADGNLLFYTDGRTVWDRNHVVMPNGNYNAGTGLYGDPSSTQSGIIVPKPGDDSIYYIFTVDEPHHENALVYPNAFAGTYPTSGDGSTPLDDDGRNRGLNYSIVDLSITGSNGSVGDVAVRNTHLVTYDINPSGEQIKYKCSEKITAVKNEAANEYWVITHFVDRFISFNVNATGVTNTGIISQIGPAITLDGYRRNSIGYLKTSPDGERLALAHQENGTLIGETSYDSGQVLIYDFNKLTGVVSNELLLIDGVQSYGVEFSPLSKKLYATYREVDDIYLTLAQFDLENPMVAASKIVIDNSLNNLFALQLAPNNKIYCATAYQQSLGVINNPDNLGVLCDFDPAGQPLAVGKRVRLGLPPFITSFFNSSFSVQNVCYGTPTNFTINSNQTIISAFWDFGDGSTSTDLNPVHLYSSPGTYSISCTATGTEGVITTNRTITIFEVPTSFISASQQVCGTPSGIVNLSDFSADILGTQSTSDFAVSYYPSAEDASNNTNILDYNYNLPLGSITMFASVYNIANPQCKILIDFDIYNSVKPVANQITDFIVCENFPYDGVEQFDLQQNNMQILGGQNPAEFTVSYHSSLPDAESNSSPLPLFYQNTLQQEVIYSRVQSNSNPNCYAVTQFNLKVVSKPISSPVSDFVLCDDASNDGVEIFDLTEKTVEILNGQSSSDFTVQYYFSAEDAQNSVNEITAPFNNTANNQLIYATIAAINSDDCRADVVFHLMVRPLPVANTIPNQYICDEDNDGFEYFNLHNYDSIVLGTQNEGAIASYYINADDAAADEDQLPNYYQNVSNPQTIFVRIHNLDNPECFDLTPMVIGVQRKPLANQVGNLITCDDESNDGQEIFDLSVQTNTILGVQSPQDFNISYYLSSSDAAAGINEMPEVFTNAINPQTIYARLTNNNLESCYTVTSFHLIVREKPYVELEDFYTMCEGQPITVHAPQGFSAYSWSDGSALSSLDITQPGNYSLTVSQTYNDIVCDYTTTFSVYVSNAAVITEINTEDWTNYNNSITVVVAGDGVYEYSLDGLHFQDSNHFYGLTEGSYTLYVKDKFGCGITSSEALLLMYPRFFTPNADGYNDFWKIKLSESEPDMKIQIFDRYGKFIIAYTGLDNGWNGTFNGRLLPSTDYWFVVTRQNGKNHYGHFTLKR